MPETQTNDKLEAARARLEKALSGLARDAATSRDTLAHAKEAEDENRVLKAHIQSLEQENLKLHEQVAGFALRSDSEAENGAKLAQLEQDKATLEQNYQMLKNRYSALQDELETNQQPQDTSEDSNLSEENLTLRRELDTMKADKEALKAELDKAIEALETMLEDA